MCLWPGCLQRLLCSGCHPSIFNYWCVCMGIMLHPKCLTTQIKEQAHPEPQDQAPRHLTWKLSVLGDVSEPHSVGSSVLINQVFLLKTCLWQRWGTESPHEERWAETVASGSYPLVMLRAGPCSASPSPPSPSPPHLANASERLPGWVAAWSSWQRSRRPGEAAQKPSQGWQWP